MACIILVTCQGGSSAGYLRTSSPQQYSWHGCGAQELPNQLSAGLMSPHVQLLSAVYAILLTTPGVVRRSGREWTVLVAAPLRLMQMLWLVLECSDSGEA